MKKLLLAIYLALMVATVNGETVKKENVKWIKLEDYCGEDTDNIEKVVVYQEVKGKNYKCGEIINGNPEGKWISWYKNGQKKEEGNFKKGKGEGNWKSWYENGNKESEVNFKNGNPEGKWIEWYENGQKKFEITCKDNEFISCIYWKNNGERVDILTTTSTGEKIIRLVNMIDEDMKDDEIEDINLIFFRIMSDIKNVTIYQEMKGKDYKYGKIKDGKREGKWTFWYENGQKKEEGNYVNGNPEGNWIDWYDNGKKKSEENYREGKEEGICKSWYENGQKESEVTYKGGEKIKGIYWNERGKIIAKITKNNAGQRIIKLSSDDAEILQDVRDGIVYREIKGKDYKCGELEDGEREGKWIEYYENGKKESEVNFKNGTPEGKYISWYENSQKSEEGNYLNGNPEGKWISWYKNGQKKEEGNYVNGECEGNWIKWYENGKKESEVTYKDGRKIKGVYWNERGKIIAKITKNNAGKRIIKLSGDNAEVLQDVRDGIVYREIKGKDYKCGELKDGKREGKWIEYYENSQKSEEGNYLNGNPEGKWISWYKNGQKKEEINFKNGNPEGKYISWYKNGKKESEVTYKDDEKIKGVYWNEKGKIVGTITKNNAGQRIIKLSGDDDEIMRGVKNGIVYREIKGKDYKCGELKDGEREGKWIEYYENGQKKEEINYVNEECERNWIKWYENGKKESEVTYKDSEKIKGVYWNEKGEIIGTITKNNAGQRIIKLSGDDDEILQDVRDGIVYQEIKGKDYKCGELKDGEREGKWIEYYESGQKKMERNYVKGKEEGNWRYYYENGQKGVEGNYVKGECEGNWIEWYENGQKKEEGNYREGKKEGNWIYYYENGQKKEEGNYVNGEGEGKWIFWNENGNKESEGNYVNGEGEGKWIYYYESGKKKEEGNCVNGEREGKWIEYYESGKKKEEGNFKKGKGEGNWKSWYENGNKESEIIVKEGKKVEGTYWNEKGEIIGTITTNSKGKTTVKLLEYNKKVMKNVGNGVVYQEIKGKDYKCGELKDGKEEGKWIEWNENGEKKSEVTYKDGEEITK